MVGVYIHEILAPEGFFFPHHDGFGVRHYGLAAHRDHAKEKKASGTQGNYASENQTKYIASRILLWFRSKTDLKNTFSGLCFANNTTKRISLIFKSKLISP